MTVTPAKAGVQKTMGLDPSLASLAYTSGLRRNDGFTWKTRE